MEMISRLVIEKNSSYIQNRQNLLLNMTVKAIILVANALNFSNFINRASLMKKFDAFRMNHVFGKMKK